MKRSGLLFCCLLFVAIAPVELHSRILGKKSKEYRNEISLLKVDRALLQEKVDSLNALIKVYEDSIDRILTVSSSEPEDIDFELSDSLLHLWYTKLGEVHSKEYDIEVENFQSDVPDSVFIRRFAAMNSFIPLPFNDIIRNYCILYSEKMKESMGTIMGLSEYYWPVFDEVLSAYSLPHELKAMVIIESLVRPTATSRVGAKGLWQFMYGTARGYGLRIDSWIDERMDPVKSTVAAARYLKDAYKVYGDWFLVIASYNCGGGNVNKAIRRSGSRNFWDLYPFLPRETRGYVPAFVGALYATYYYKEYGIIPKKAGIATPVDTFVLNKSIHYGQISEKLGLSRESIAELNPQYLHEIIPGEEHPCVLRLPMKYSNAFIDNLDSIYVYKREVFFDPVAVKKIKDETDPQGRIVYKVKSGDVLGRIATRYGVKVSQIKKWNGMKSDVIRPGQKLVIYRKR